MNNKLLGFFSVLFFTIPFTTHAAIQITEIAWMGIAAENGQFGEWFELHNDGAEPADLNGWKIYGDAGSQLIFTLTKTIPANSYLLVERTTASMVDPVPGISDESGTFGGGGLSNVGEDVLLKDSGGVVIQTLSFASGWPAGDATTKHTMQWNGSSWITAQATPKAATIGLQEESSDEDEDQGSPSSQKPVKKYTPKFTLDIPAQFYQHVDYTFDPVLTLEDGLSHIKGPIEWNMGDGTAITQKTLAPVTHRYRYPGSYTLWIGSFKTVFDQAPYLEISKVIQVGSPEVVISVVDGEAVKIENHSKSTADLSLWQITADGKRFSFPKRTMLAGDASITISAITLGFDSLKNVSLTRPGGEVLLTNHPSNVLGVSTFEEPGNDYGGEVLSQEVSSKKKGAMQNRTKKIIFGAISLTVLALCLLLERFMAKRE